MVHKPKVGFAKLSKNNDPSGSRTRVTGVRGQKLHKGRRKAFPKLEAEQKNKYPGEKELGQTPFSDFFIFENEFLKL